MPESVAQRDFAVQVEGLTKVFGGTGAVRGWWRWTQSISPSHLGARSRS